MAADDEKPPKDVITVEEVSAILGPPRRTIYQLTYQDPDFPRPFKPGKRLFWIRSEVLAYREKKQKEYAERHKPLSPQAAQSEKRRLDAARTYARMLRHAPRIPPPKK